MLSSTWKQLFGQQDNMQQQRRQQQRACHAPPPNDGARWLCSPFRLMAIARLHESTMLTADPPAVSSSRAVKLRLFLGKAEPLCKEKECGRQFQQLLTAVLEQDQQLNV
jgi:hypothetical protein